jgi:hypothetical protein
MTTQHESPTPLTNEAYIRLCAYCQKNLILPEDALRQFVGLPPREPSLVPARVLERDSDLLRFLAILEYLHKSWTKKFEIAAPQVKGTKRTYFSQSQAEIICTGSSNTAAKIPLSTWWVSTNNDGRRKSTMVQNLMMKLGFSDNYSAFVGSACAYRVPCLPSRYVQKFIACRNAIQNS